MNFCKQIRWQNTAGSRAEEYKLFCAVVLSDPSWVIATICAHSALLPVVGWFPFYCFFCWSVYSALLLVHLVLILVCPLSINISLSLGPLPSYSRWSVPASRFFTWNFARGFVDKIQLAHMQRYTSFFVQLFFLIWAEIVRRSAVSCCQLVFIVSCPVCC